MQERPARGPRLLAALLLSLAACAAARAQGPASSPVLRATEGATTIDAQKIEGISDIEVTATGSVELRRDETSIFTDYLKYNQEIGSVEAKGGVRLERDSDRFFGPSLRYNLNDDTGVFDHPHFVIPRDRVARGAATKLDFLGKDHLRMKDASYTTCSPSRPGWVIQARDLDLDYDSAEGHAKGARLRFLDTTIAALPYASFPLTKQRKTGFLTPSYSQTTARGLQLEVPFYWNIAPERDLTITPVYMTKRGTQLKTDFRYLSQSYNGDVHFEYLPNDHVLDTARSGFSLQHHQVFASGLNATLDLNRVSDDRYFVDLASNVTQVSVSNLLRQGSLSYGGGIGAWNYGVSATVQSFQTLQDPAAPVGIPYHRIPQLVFSAARNEIGGLADANIPVEYVRFTHPSQVEGSRIQLNPTIAVPFVTPGWFVIPKLGLHYASYALDRTAPGQDGHQGVSVPWLSLDSGLVFERDLRWFGSAARQTLEPRLFYVYAPYRNQDQIPIFDTGVPDFNYAQMFTENRFVGGDRFGDANQMTAALTSRILAPNGAEALRATIGQVVYFADERVGIAPGASATTYHHSDILASVGGNVAPHWIFDTSLQYSPPARQTQRYGIALRYQPEIAKVVNASYRFQRAANGLAPLQQIDISGQWPVKAGWYAVGRYNYSMLDRRLLEGLGGIEYNAGCWVFRAVFQRLQASTQVASTGFFFQLELSGLGSLGTGETVDVLKRSVAGYAVTNPSNPSLVPPSLRPKLPFDQVF